MHGQRSDPESEGAGSRDSGAGGLEAPIPGAVRELTPRTGIDQLLSARLERGSSLVTVLPIRSMAQIDESAVRDLERPPPPQAWADRF